MPHKPTTAAPEQSAPNADAGIPTDTPQLDGSSEAEARAERYRQRTSHRADRRPQGMVPGRERRRTGIERGTMRLISTGGVIGIATILGAVLVGQDIAGWIVGLVVGLVSVILAAVLWSSRQL
jgi:hypothetical protein